MSTTFSQDVNGNEVLKLTQPEAIILEGTINGNSDVKFVSEAGYITLERDINSNANLLAVAFGDVKFQGEFNSESGSKLVSKTGNVWIGKSGEQKNINSSARLSVTASRDVIFHHTDFNSDCEVDITSKNGKVLIKGDINSNAKLFIIAESGIVLEGDINSNVVVEMICTQGSITITGHIHSNARVRLTAADNILIKKEIDGNLSVVARCEGKITVMGHINNHAYVELRAHKGIHVQGNISDNSVAKLSVVTAAIVIDGNVDDNSKVLYWPNMLSLQGNGDPVLKKWVTEYSPSLDSGKSGDWWNNWLWSYGFVSNQIHRPKSYENLRFVIASLRRRGVTKVKGMGGSWSSSDVSLPQDDDQSVESVSLLKRGENNTSDLRHALRHMQEKDTPMDMYPTEVSKSLAHSSQYDTPALQRVVKSGIDLKLAAPEFAMIDTKFMASSLQHQLKKQVVYGLDGDKDVPTYRYWVEAGITMSDLNVLLDHHEPRLAIQASGGSPGATLAGTISTATHGGEFKAPLLIDRILAVHLIGPGGQEWWIEGGNQVIDKADLQALYPAIPDSRFISSATWSHPDISAPNFLHAVVTSMGTMGIIYSVVLEVVEQFSIEQVTYKYPSWERFLKEAGVSEEDLGNKMGQANEDVLQFLMNGTANKTGIPTKDNQYIDLAINPLSKSCWVVNRKFVPMIAEDENQLDTMSNYIQSVSSSMGEGADLDGIMHSKLAGRLLDFLSIPRDTPGLVAGIGNISNFMSSVSNSPLLLSSLMAHTQIKAMWNQWSEPDPRRGREFMSDILEGILDALQGTYHEPKVSIAGLSYKVGAIGWPSTGIPGRAFEVAVSHEIAFSYLQDILKLVDVMAAANRPLMGYISVRVCPQTSTLMGMQQFRHSVMVEVVAHRTPESSLIIDDLIQFTQTYDGFKDGERPPFHWGLDTEGFDANYLKLTPFAKPNGPTAKTKIELFKAVKEIILDGHPAWFDNRFVARMGL
jgi:hypothetical protein